MTDTRPRTGTTLQVTATSPKLQFSVDDRPAITDFDLPGPRRKREGRGGAQTKLEVMRYLIRCPLLPALASAIAPRGGRPPAYPDIFWVFFTAATREFRTGEALMAALRDEVTWVEIAKEFYFEHNIALPAVAGVEWASFNHWRTSNIIDRENQLDRLLQQLTLISVPLALAVRRSEVGSRTAELLAPLVNDIVASDGTVRNAPSAVRGIVDFDEDGNPALEYSNSRAKASNRRTARVHEPQQQTSKRSGSPEGLYNVAASTKGSDSYTRTVLGVDMGEAHEGEIPVAMRMFHRIMPALDDSIPVLVYDGALTPINAQELMAHYGTLCVNANHARGRKNSAGAGESRADTFDHTTTTTTGEGIHAFGHKAGNPKRTYVTPLADVECQHGGTTHQHHLAADDGAVYEIDRPVHEGGDPQRIAALTSTDLQRHTSADGRFWFKLTLTGQCPRGGAFTVTYDLHRTEPDSRGNLSWRQPISNIRPLPDVAENYAKTMGHRNQSESFFSWAENCYYRHDRSASWGRDAQLFDLIGVALLHNSETWAHLTYRHPDHAIQVAAAIADLEPLNLSVIKKKPLEQRKKAKTEYLHTTQAWLPAPRADANAAPADEAQFAGPPPALSARPVEGLAAAAASGRIKTKRPPRRS